MKKYIFVAMSCFAMAATAQETYDNANLVESDLNGTARYVGMGGAMEALGADISTIGTNPAGVGLFRRDYGSLSFGWSNYGVGPDKEDVGSFDQAGYVLSYEMNDNRYLNMAVNYHKSRNFNNCTTVTDRLDLASQNALSYIKIGSSSSEQLKDLFLSQLDVVYYNTFLLGSDGGYGYNFGDSYALRRSESGYVGDYDFNISGNVSDRVYLGMTMGIHDLHYESATLYTENLIDYNNLPIGHVDVVDGRETSGTGFDLKFGAIFFPIEESPFRVGVSLSTPTWYSLRTENYTYLENGTNIEGYDPRFSMSGELDFSISTPWKFGLSLGHTVSNQVALGASYEYSGYNHLSTGNEESGRNYDYGQLSYGNDMVMNRHAKSTLQGVHTIKLGAEIKPVKNFAVRAGYNYVSPKFKANAMREPFLNSLANYYSSQTDYTNWKATNRLTLGLGYTIGSFSVDLAYQYSATKGEFHPFADSYGDFEWTEWDNNGNIVDQWTESIDNYAFGVDVTKSRHQLLMTLGYRF